MSLSVTFVILLSEVIFTPWPKTPDPPASTSAATELQGHHLRLNTSSGAEADPNRQIVEACHLVAAHCDAQPQCLLSLKQHQVLFSLDPFSKTLNFICIVWLILSNFQVKRMDKPPSPSSC